MGGDTSLLLKMKPYDFFYSQDWPQQKMLANYYYSAFNLENLGGLAPRSVLF